MTEQIQALVRGVKVAPRTLQERNAVQRELLLNLARMYPDVALWDVCAELGEEFGKRFPHDPR